MGRHSLSPSFSFPPLPPISSPTAFYVNERELQFKYKLLFPLVKLETQVFHFNFHMSVAHLRREQTGREGPDVPAVQLLTRHTEEAVGEVLQASLSLIFY